MPDSHTSDGDQSGPPFQAVPATPHGTLPVLPPDQTKDLHAVPWHLVNAQGDRLVISINASPMVTSSLKGVSITETPTEVTIVVYGTPPPEGPVLAIRYDMISMVQLAKPLGSRRLTGQQQPSSR